MVRVDTQREHCEVGLRNGPRFPSTITPINLAKRRTITGWDQGEDRRSVCCCCTGGDTSEGMTEDGGQ